MNSDSLLFAGHGNPSKPILPYSQNNINFHYLAPTINITGINQYQTKLDGFDKQWSEWTAKTDKAYTNLPEGSYTFRARGKTPTGQNCPETTYTFEVLPPWWRTWWAYAGYAFLGVCIVYFFSQWRNRQLREQSKKLELIIQERTQEIKQRVEELSAINSVQKGLVSQLEMEGIYQLVGNQVRDLFKANIAYIAILDDKKEIIHFPYGYGDTFAPMNFGQGLTSKIINSGKSLLINQDVSKTYSTLGIKETGKDVTSYLGVPILIGKEVIGVMSVQSREQINRFKEADEHLLNTIAAQVGAALHNAQLFEEAERAKTVAEEANQAKSAFLSTVSHELRTPLTSVIGFAKIIKKRLDERILPFVQSEEKKTQRAIKQVNQNLDVVISEGERLTTLINTVLDLAKIEAGRLDWNMETIQIKAIIQQAVAATSSLLDEKSLPLHLEIEENLPPITGDKDRLIQVMINLISNAIKFTNEGNITIEASLQNELIIVKVKDSGIGISKEDLPKVFEKFKQVGDTLTDKPKGTGLGLPICKEIIEYHKGKIWAESELGQGSTFLFQLPANIENAKSEISKPISEDEVISNVIQEKETEATTVHQVKKKTIMIVDDELDIRNLLRQEVSEKGYHIMEAINGKEAIKSIRSQPPDLIILDIMMPEMNGFDVAAILKNDPITQHIPIIVVSIMEDKQRIARLGVDRYFTKPIDMELLLKEIAVLLK